MGSKNYSTSVDIWSVGCIFAELVNRKPLFAGTSDEDQLMKIFKLRGTPDCENWDGLKDLPLYKVKKLTKFQSDFAVHAGEPLSKLIPDLNEEGLELCESMLQCNPAERITAKDALTHKFFEDVPSYIKDMK